MFWNDFGQKVTDQGELCALSVIHENHRSADVLGGPLVAAIPPGGKDQILSGWVVLENGIQKLSKRTGGGS